MNISIKNVSLLSILKFTVSIPNHTHKQQATSHNSSRILIYGQPDKAQVSSRVYVWPATDGWMVMVWCLTGTDQFVCCLGQSPLSATGGAILHMYGTWSDVTNLFFVNIEVDTLFGMPNILPSLERT